MKLNIILSSLTFRYTRHVEFLKLVPERLTSEHLRISEKIKIVNEKGLNPDSDMKFFETDNEDLINATREAEVSKRVESVMQALKKANSDILKQICINVGFDGVHIVINSFYQTEQTGYKEFYINFNYKKEDSRYWDSKKDQIYLDYKKYIHNDYHDKDVIQTIVYDFNNKPRLFKPNHLKSSTVCLNNTEFHKILFTEKIIKKYENKKEGIDKILLINALNEWGENMSFEPSNKYGFYNINLLTDKLI